MSVVITATYTSPRRTSVSLATKTMVTPLAVAGILVMTLCLVTTKAAEIVLWISSKRLLLPRLL